MSPEKTPIVTRKELPQEEDCIKEDKTFFGLWERAGWQQRPIVHNDVFEEKLVNNESTRSTRETKQYCQPDMLYYK